MDDDGVEGVPAFRGTVRRQRAGPLYQLGLLLTALCMAILPALYVALIGGVGWSVYRGVAELAAAEYATAKLRLYGAIALFSVGCTVIFFLFKPLLARPARGPDRFSIDRAQQPLFFDFVDRLCAIVGAPRPRRIDLDTEANASASFRRGLLSMASRDLVLTVGLPLVSGLTVRQLGGVLAHEFGHFSQGAGMRLTYVIRSVNGWFARVVYERDVWDERLKIWAEQGKDWRVLVLGNLARAGVALSRGILGILMRAGHAVSCFALRQMEFDADGYGTQVAGASAFEETARRLPVLGTGCQLALQDLGQLSEQNRLVDDLPAYAAARAAMLPATTRQAIEDEALAERTKLFDTHPSTRARIDAAHRLGARGVLDDARGASALFTGYAELCRAVTRHTYRAHIGSAARRATLIAAGELIRTREREARAQRALNELVGGEVDVEAVTVDTEPRPVEGDVPALAATVLELRAQSPRPDGSDAVWARLQSQEGELAAKAAALVIWHAGRRLDMTSWGLDANATPADLETHIEESLAERQETRARCRTTIAAALRRIELALGVLARDDLRSLLAAGDDLHEETRRWAVALRGLQAAQPARDRLAITWTGVLAIGKRVGEGDREFLGQALLKTVGSMRSGLEGVREALADTPHPEPTPGHPTLARLVPDPLPGKFDTALDASGGVVRQLYELQGRSLARLAEATLRVEEALLAETGTNAEQGAG